MAVLMAFFTIFRPFSATLLTFSVSQILVGAGIRSNIFLLPYAKIHYFVVRIGHNSSPDDFTIPLKSHDLSQIFDQTSNFEKK